MRKAITAIVALLWLVLGALFLNDEIANPEHAVLAFIICIATATILYAITWTGKR